jgi:hypothetical protein
MQSKPHPYIKTEMLTTHFMSGQTLFAFRTGNIAGANNTQPCVVLELRDRRVLEIEDREEIGIAST